MSIVKDLFYTNRKALKDTSKLLVKNWPILFMGLVYSILSLVLMMIISLFMGSIILGFFTGIITFIAISALVSNYLYLLHTVVEGGRLRIQTFKDGFIAYLRKIYTIFFIGWVASLLLDMFVIPVLGGLLSGVINVYVINLIINILLLIALNPLPETIYQKQRSPIESIKYAYNFITENWLEWFLPNVILIGVLYITTGSFIGSFLSFNMGFAFSISAFDIVIYIIGQIIFSFAMIYRGVLFKMLSTSTRRKRLFMRNMYK